LPVKVTDYREFEPNFLNHPNPNAAPGLSLTAARKEAARRSGPLLSVRCRCRSFDHATPWDCCRPCREPDSAGRLSGHRLAAGRAFDLASGSAGRAGFGSSCCFLSWERRYNGSESGFVPIKEKWQFALQTRCHGERDIFGFAFPHSSFLVSDCAALNGDCSGVRGRHTPQVPRSSYEHTSTASRTSGNCRFGATLRDAPLVRCG
jgi:hypothetical protein